MVFERSEPGQSRGPCPDLVLFRALSESSSCLRHRPPTPHTTLSPAIHSNTASAAGVVYCSAEHNSTPASSRSLTNQTNCHSLKPLKHFRALPAPDTCSPTSTSSFLWGASAPPPAPLRSALSASVLHPPNPLKGLLHLHISDSTVFHCLLQSLFFTALGELQNFSPSPPDLVCNSASVIQELQGTNNCT